MTRVLRTFSQRLGKVGLSAILGVLLVALLSATPALGTFWSGFGSSPSKECKSGDWNGEYLKVEFDKNLKPGKIETSKNVSKDDISFSVSHKTVTWSNASDYAVFRIYEKGGIYSETNSGLWQPGQGSEFGIWHSLSHVTFCFTKAALPSIDIQKKTNGADPSETNPNYIRAGQPVTWTYVVENTGNVELKDVAVTDDQLGQVGSVSKLKPGEKKTFTKTGTAVVGPYSNTGTVTAKSSVGNVSDSDTSGYFGSNPVITLAVTGPTGPVNEGDTFDWNIVVSNAGNVPLSNVVVQKDGVAIPGCSWTLLGVGETVTCSLEDTATVGSETASFQAFGSGPGGGTAAGAESEILVRTYTVNRAPVAVDDDFYEMNERDAFDTDVNATLTIPSVMPPIPGLLANDSDPDGDTFTAVPVLDLVTDEGGSVDINEDGSFAYTPGDFDWEPEGEPPIYEYTDSWEYTIVDSPGGLSDTATVTVLVKRVVCSGDTVIGVDPADENFYGEFTALNDVNNDPTCKLYTVTASASENLVTLDVPPGQGDPVFFSGLLSGEPKGLDENGEFILGLEYDPDLGGVEPFRIMQLCEGTPTIDSGVVTDADIPLGETWCIAATLSTVVDGEMQPTYLVYGQEDPGIRFR